MFGFFKKNDAKPLPYLNDENPIHQAIIRLWKGDKSGAPALVNALATTPVFLLFAEPHDLNTLGSQAYNGKAHFVVFTQRKLIPVEQSRAYPHVAEMTLLSLASKFKDVAVGVLINPGNKEVGWPVPPGVFNALLEITSATPPPVPPSLRGGLPPLPPLPSQPPRPPPPDHSPTLEAVIVKLRAGNWSQVFALFDALADRTVTMLVQEPGNLQTALILELAGVPHIAVFTKPELAEPWKARGYPHLIEIPMPTLCASASNDAVGLSINPDHPLFGYPMNPGLFKQFREVLADSRPLWKEGGLYHVPNSSGTYSVLKILKLDEKGVHIRPYSNQYPAAPAAVDESTLFMKGLDRQPGELLGMGH